MSAEDALLWNIEEDPILRSTTAAVTLLERAPDPERLRAGMLRAVVEIPRLRQRVAPLPLAVGNTVWVRDPDFDLSYHLRWVRVPRPQGPGAPAEGQRGGGSPLAAVLPLAASLAMAGFDRSRPLWEFLVVEGLPEGRAALVQKLHHAITDGVAVMRLMERVYDRSPDAPWPAPEELELPREEEPGALGLVAEALGRRLREGREQARQGRRRARAFLRRPLRTTLQEIRGAAAVLPALVPDREPLCPIARQRSSRYRFHALDTDLGALRRAAHASGCRVNDAFLAALTGGWRHYHERHGAQCRALRAMIPVNLRSSGGGEGRALAGNQLTMARLVLPLEPVDPGRRMVEIRKRLLRERERPLAEVTGLLAQLANGLPGALRTPLLGAFSTGCDLIASCVPGLPEELYVAGARVERLYTFGPTAGTALNATLFSCGGRATLALNVDPGAVADHEVLSACMAEGLGEVLKLG